MPRRAALFSPVLLVLIVVALLVAVTFGAIALRLARPYPINPWESALVIDAVRWTRGEAVYVATEDGPATTMYGPLASLTAAGAFEVVGPGLLPGRLVSLASALLLVTLLAWVLTQGRPWPERVIAWGMLFSLNLPSGSYFVDARPDMPAALFGVLFLLAFAQGNRHWRIAVDRRTHRFARVAAIGWYTLATALLLVAFFWKQTAAVLAAAPLVAALLRPNRPKWYRLWRTDFAVLLPPLAIVTAVAAVRWINPIMFHYMFVVPAQYHIAWSTWGVHLWEMLLVVPLAVLLGVRWWLRGPRASLSDDRLRWTLACLIVTLPTGLVAAAKTGGDRNSYLFAWLALVAFCILQLDHVLFWLTNRGQSLVGRLALASGVALLLSASVISDVDYAGYWAALARNGDAHYDQAVTKVASLSGQVLSPNDPTIALWAKGTVGRTLAVERDAAGWSEQVPEPVRTELAGADWVLRVRGPWDKLNGWLSAGLLRELGFEPSALVGSATYELWRRNRPTNTSSNDRPETAAQRPGTQSSCANPVHPDSSVVAHRWAAGGSDQNKARRWPPARQAPILSYP